MPRIFFAIPMSVAIRRTFISCRKSLVSEDPSWAGEKWVAAENLHITLRFLGTVAPPDVDRCIENVSRLSSTIEPYRLCLNQVRAIPQRRSASLVWVAPSVGAEETASVADVIAQATSLLAFRPEGKRFRPHVTLCRARSPRRLAASAVDEIDRVLHMSDERAISMSVPGVTLIASTLTPRGPIYEEIAMIPFRG